LLTFINLLSGRLSYDKATSLGVPPFKANKGEWRNELNPQLNGAQHTTMDECHSWFLRFMNDVSMCSYLLKFAQTAAAAATEKVQAKGSKFPKQHIKNC